MLKLSIVLMLALVLAACSGGNQPANTPLPSYTPTTPPAAEVAVKEVLQEKVGDTPIVRSIATFTPVPLTGTATSTPSTAGYTPTLAESSSTPLARSTNVSITCTLNREQRRVRCESTGKSNASTWNWTSNATSGMSGGRDFEFVIEEEVVQIEVTLETCVSNSCQTTSSTINNSRAQVQGNPTRKGSTDFHGRNIFKLPFDEFPFSCKEFASTEFTTAFFPPGRITVIEPMGKMAAMSAHVTPTDHLYVHREFSVGDENVLAPADGFIVKISRFPEDKSLNDTDESGNWLGDSGPVVPDFRVLIMHSCTFFTIFIHLGDLAPDVAEATGEIQQGGLWQAGREHTPIPLKAGEPIAKFGSQSLDWSVHDANTVLKGFVVPEHYDSEPFKVHTVDPFQFYMEPVRTALLSKVVRKEEPRAGRIDYDIEGAIVGNWFLDGTIDYAGSGQPGLGSQKGHLSIAYGSIDPSQLRISIGADTDIDENLCNICFGTYGVRGNQPDPATVTSDVGLIKYELMSRDEESRWVREQVGSTSLGTFLVQHLGDQTIRVEVISGKSPDEVVGFSDASLIYRR